MSDAEFTLAGETLDELQELWEFGRGDLEEWFFAIYLERRLSCGENVHSLSYWLSTSYSEFLYLYNRDTNSLDLTLPYYLLT